MTREKLSKRITQIRSQIESLQNQLEDLEEQKAAADLAEGHAMIEKKKISPEELKFLMTISEEEKRLILKRRNEE